MPLGSEKITMMAASNTGNPPDTIQILVCAGGGSGQAAPGNWGGGGGGAGGGVAIDTSTGLPFGGGIDPSKDAPV